MTYDQFQKSLVWEKPKAEWPPDLKAMWYFFKDNWGRAHQIAQDIDNSTGHRIHGLLHWQEGDHWNAQYWYRQAGRPFPETNIKAEAKAIVIGILENV